MRAAVDGHVGSYQRPRADRNEAGVEDGAVEIDENALADADVGTVIDVDWPFDPGVGGEERFVLVFCLGLRWEGG